MINFPETISTLHEILQRLNRLEQSVSRLSGNVNQDHLSIDEFASVVGRTPYTCREWARLGRLNATKKRSGRGKYLGWVISREELQRYQREGLLPLNPAYRKRVSG